jgi:cell division protein ZapB
LGAPAGTAAAARNDLRGGFCRPLSKCGHGRRNKRAGVFKCVDRVQAPAYSFNMSQGNDMLTELREIGGQLDRLLELCQRLTEENRSLRVSQEQLSAERANLMAKNEQARSRVEAMIARLRSLENNA